MKNESRIGPALASFINSYPPKRKSNGRRAFLWVDGDPKNPDFRYLVIVPGGTFAEGTEQSQEACESAAAQILKQQ